MPVERSMPRRVLGALVVAVMVLALGACGDDDEDDTEAGDPADGTQQATEPTEEADGDGGEDEAGGGSGADDEGTEVAVTVPGGEGGEYAFEAEGLDGLEAGLVTMTLTNEGEEVHQAMLLRLKEGTDVEAFGAAAVRDPTGVEALSLVEGYGGPTAVAPGASGSSTQVLDAGDYLLICIIPDDQGVPHAQHGMIRPFTVAESDAGTEPDGPSAEDADVTLVDFAFSQDGEFEAGQEVTVTNDGEQDHELAAFRLDEGATADDVIVAETERRPVPATPAGGVGSLAPGRSARFTLPDEPGRYALICFVPDVTGDGQPHALHGMKAEVEVS